VKSARTPIYCARFEQMGRIDLRQIEHPQEVRFGVHLSATSAVLPCRRSGPSVFALAAEPGPAHHELAAELADAGGRQPCLSATSRVRSPAIRSPTTRLSLSRGCTTRRGSPGGSTPGRAPGDLVLSCSASSRTLPVQRAGLGQGRGGEVVPDLGQRRDHVPAPLLAAQPAAFLTWRAA